MPTTIQQAIQTATAKLKDSSDTPKLDAEVLLAHLLKKNRVHFLTWPEEPLSQITERFFFDLVERRAEGEPVAYITGMQEFWSLKLKVTTDTLIPRPETEVVVEQTLVLIPDDTACDIADLGTGSGAIALAIASECPQCNVFGIDQSKSAIRVAETNARQLDLSNVSFSQGNWLEGVDAHSFDIIVANPPYVALNDPHLQQGDVRFEPQTALVSGDDGLDDIRNIIPQAKKCLKRKGWLVLEHGYDQQPQIMALLDAAGFRELHGLTDYAKQPRVVLARL
ncbi:MAG: peptide chain release factor N(5)-glutamine methyltransferase [Gammaproteobacteria bacterium]|nr:peptide chain release factor N(5)-glutamine methyltransferase [Gammaproteobacteria bacterium]